MEKRDNYAIQVAQAKKHFLTYDQQELMERCRLKYDEAYFYTDFLSEHYRIGRTTGDMHRLHQGNWMPANGFGEVMTILDWLCDSKAGRYITGRWINVVTHGNYFHGNLQDSDTDGYAELFDRDPEGFKRGCLALKGEPMTGADHSYAIELVDGLRVMVQLWHGDEEFPPRLRCLWDENTLQYIRYETTWFAVGLLLQRIKEYM